MGRVLRPRSPVGTYRSLPVAYTQEEAIMSYSPMVTRDDDKSIQRVTIGEYDIIHKYKNKKKSEHGQHYFARMGSRHDTPVVELFCLQDHAVQTQLPTYHGSSTTDPKCRTTIAQIVCMPL